MSQLSELAVLILAAGRGLRMNSEKPKVLHHLMGRPLIGHVINSALHLEPRRLVIVTGFGAKEVELAVTAFMKDLSLEKRPPEPVFVRQSEQLGTGHAVSVANKALADFSGQLLIMAGDVPLISPDTLKGFIKTHQTLRAGLSVLTMTLDDPSAYGRVIRDETGALRRIVEYRDASETERSVREVNSGLYIADSKSIFKSIENLKANNNQGEYYLTDVVADFWGSTLKAAAVKIHESRAFELQGVNDRLELAQAQSLLKNCINSAWLRAGVTMLDSASVYIESQVCLAPDATLWPGVILTGLTDIGPGATIGPYCHLHNCLVPAGANVPGYQSFAELDFSRNDRALRGES